MSSDLSALNAGLFYFAQDPPLILLAPADAGQQTLEQGHVEAHGGDLRLQGRLEQGHIEARGVDLTLSLRFDQGHIEAHGLDLLQPGDIERGHIEAHGVDLLHQQHLPQGHVVVQGRSLVFVPVGAPEWQLVITARNGSAVGTFSSDGAADDRPVLDFDLQDVCNEIGIGHISLPAEHDANDLLAEDRLIHYFARGNYVTTFIIREPVVQVVDQSSNNQVATYRIEHLVAFTTEGIVEPPGVEGARPASADRMFDSSDPARDNSDFGVPEVLGSVTDAQSNYAVTPYGAGILYPDDVQVIGPAGYGWLDDAPPGDHWVYVDHDFSVDGYYVTNQTADNGWEGRVDSIIVVPWTIGFGDAATATKQFITAGVHRLWARVQNESNPGRGPCTFAAEWVRVGANDEPIALEVCTDASWRHYYGAPPGFTPGEIGELVLAEEQAHGVWAGDFEVVPTFTGTHDSRGRLWTETADVSCKAEIGAEEFWLRKMTSTYCDMDATFDFATGKVLWHLYVKGTARQPATVTLTHGGNLREFAVPGAPYIASQFLAAWNDGGDLSYRTIAQTPPAEHPVKRRGLALGADHSSAEVDRDGDGQLDLFNRAREMPALDHVTNAATPDAQYPGVAYWKWHGLNVVVSSRWLASGELELIAVSLRLDGNGRMQATPRAGDFIIPPTARPSVVLRRMTAPSVGGQARVASPVTRA